MPGEGPDVPSAAIVTSERARGPEGNRQYVLRLRHRRMPTARRPSKTAGDARGATRSAKMGAKTKGRGPAPSTGGAPLTSTTPLPSQPRLWSEAAPDTL